MKKKITFMFLILALSGSAIFSQPLQNTLWKVYFPSGTFFAYYYFGVDTGYISFDNVIFTQVGTYEVYGDTMRVVSLTDDDCLVADTGVYTYLVQNDTLKYSLIFDQCAQRATNLTTFTWVRFSTGIQPAGVLRHIDIFPNPAHATVTIRAPYRGSLTILDLSGKEILNHKMTGPDITIDVSGLQKGLYLVKQVSESGRQIGTFIKGEEY